MTNPTTRNHFAQAIKTLSLLFALSMLALVSGCGDDEGIEALRQAALNPQQQERSFDAIASTLNETEGLVRWPTDSIEILLDRPQTTDGQPAMAVLNDNPLSAEPPSPEAIAGRTFSYLHLASENANFVAAQIRSGDQIDYYLPSSADDLLTQQMVASFGMKSRVDCTVRRVVDGDTLELAEGFRAPILQPQAMVAWRVDNVRRVAIHRELAQWKETGKPAIGWEPTPDAEGLLRLVAMLNDWTSALDKTETWSADPLVVEAAKSVESGFDLASLRFSPNEGRLLQEAAWLRDVARRAPEGDALDRAAAVFDWVVRNIQLETEKSMLGVAQRPWQALVSGRGTAETRAWIFILALRQIGVDAALLAIDDKPSEPPRPWCVGVFDGDDLRLFDCQLGLPLSESLDEPPATLAQFRKQSDMLEKFADGEERPYRIAADDLSRVVALVETTPLYVSRRGRLIESQLAGRERIALSTSPSRIAERLRQQGIDARLWSISADVDRRQHNLDASARAILAAQYEAYELITALWKGRVLQLKGDDHRWELNHADKRVRVYAENLDPRVYLARYCRVSDRMAGRLAQLPKYGEAAQFAKQNASYWLGLIAYEDGDYPVAIDYFQKRTLDDFEKGIWRAGARYNLARSREKIAEALEKIRLAGSTAPTPIVLESLVAVDGSFDAAALRAKQIAALAAARDLLAADESFQSHGNHLRARMIDRQLAALNQEPNAANR